MVAALVRPAGALSAALGAILVGAIHVGAGPLNLVQRDEIVGASVLLAALAARRGGAGVVLAGAVVGFAATVEPFAFAFLPAVPLIAAHDRGWRAVALAAAGTGIGAGLALAAVFGRLWLVGGLEEFVAIQTQLVLPYYGGLDTRSGEHFLVRGLISQAALAPMLPFAAIGLVARPTPELRRTRVVAIAVVGYGVVHLVAQAKAFSYHSLPLFYGLSVAAALGAERALRRAPTAWFLAVSLVLVDSLALPLLAWHSRRVQRTEVTRAIVDDLRPHLRPGDTVQSLDVTSGAVDALRVLRVPPPGRHIYDFVFFVGPPDRPVVARMRREFLADLAARRPRAIVVTNEQWPAPERGYERWETWPEFTALRDRDYALAIERGFDREWGYRIYLRRE